MKNFKLMMLAAISACTLFATSCKKDDDDSDNKETSKLISSVVTIKEWASEKDSVVFSYNNGVLATANRYDISEGGSELLNSKEYQYTNGKLINILSYNWDGPEKFVSYKDSFVYDTKNRPVKQFVLEPENGKFVLSGTVYTITFNSDNLPEKVDFDEDEYITYEYTNGNLIKLNNYYLDKITSVSAYTYDDKKNPFRGHNYYIGDRLFYSTNNYVTHQNKEYSESRTFEYGTDGYPTTITKNVSGQVREVLKIYYK